VAYCVFDSTLAIVRDTCLSSSLEPALNVTRWGISCEVGDVEHAVANSVTAESVTLEALLVATVELNTLVTRVTSSIVYTVRVGCLNATKTEWVWEAALAIEASVVDSRVTSNLAAEVCSGPCVVIVCSWLALALAFSTPLQVLETRSVTLSSCLEAEAGAGELDTSVVTTSSGVIFALARTNTV